MENKEIEKLWNQKIKFNKDIDEEIRLLSLKSGADKVELKRLRIEAYKQWEADGRPPPVMTEERIAAKRVEQFEEELKFEKEAAEAEKLAIEEVVEEVVDEKLEVPEDTTIVEATEEEIKTTTKAEKRKELLAQLAALEE